VPPCASMGPPIYIGGNQNPQEVFFLEMLASMGPPIYIGGNLEEILLNNSLRNEASMGPPIYIGGN